MKKIACAGVLIVAVLLVGGMVLLAVLNYAAPQADASACQSNHITGPGTFTNICGLRVKEGAAAATLGVRAQLTAGLLEWTLKDPAGNVRWEGRAEAGQGDLLEKTFDAPEAGTWQIEIRLVDASGDYETPWKVK